MMSKPNDIQPLLFLTSVLVCSLLIGGIAIYFLFLDSYEELDRNKLKEDSERVMRAFKDRLTDLQATTSDWGAWDEAFEYVTVGSSSFENTNLTEHVIADLNIRMLAYLNRDLRPLVIMEFQKDQGNFSLNDQSLPFLHANSSLIKDSQHKTVVGLVNYRGTPAMAAASVVSRASGFGPSAGRVIFVRTLDQELLRSISEQTLIEVSMTTELSPTSSQGDDEDESFKLAHGEIFLHRDDALAYFPLTSMTGEKLGYLRLKMAREIAKFGRKSVIGIMGIYSFSSLAIVTIVFIGLQLSGTRKILGRLTKTHQLLERREAYLRALVDSVPGYVAWFNQSLKYLGVNKKLSDDYGLKPKDFIGQDIGFQNRGFDPELKKELKTFFASRQKSKQASVIAGTDSNQRKFLVCLEKYDNNQAAVTVSIDITAAWKNELQVAKDRQAVVTANRLSALGEMAGGIAHEINNPLAIIQGSCRQLKRQLAKGESEATFLETIDVIDRTTARIEKIIHGLRSFSRDGSDDPFIDADLNKIVEEAVSLCQARLDNRDIELRLSLAAQGINVRCRPVQMGQVLLNLLNNAFDAVISLDEKWIALTTAKNGDLAEISITDSGPGIPEQIAMRMMDPFFTTKPVGAGTGLGLSISTEIIHAHHGTLFYDKANHRTRFVIQLPLQNQK